MSKLWVPQEVTFEEAIALTQSLLAEMEQSGASESEIEAVIQKLVSTVAGARGFFVVYLTDDRTLVDYPSESVRRGLQSSPDIVAELLLKNIAMSSAMVVAHRRQNNESLAKKSERVSDRASQLIQSLQLPLGPQIAQQILESARTGEGHYQSFLNKWGYDAEQRQAIADAVQPFSDPSDHFT